MGAILDRSDENRNRKGRIKGLKRGPGVFVYEGGGFDTEAIPTVLLRGQGAVQLDASGAPVVDASGAPVFEKAGTPVLDAKGMKQLGGVPIVKRIPIEVYKLRGKAFPIGKEVVVDDASLALKLRGMDFFHEVEGASLEVTEEGGEATEGDKPKRGPGRPKKLKSSEPS